MRTEHKTDTYTLTEVYVGGHRLCEQHFHRCSDVPLHRGDYPVIVLPLCGSYTMYASHNTFTAGPGKLLCIQDTRNRPTEDAQPGTRLFVFTVHPDLYTPFGLQPLMIYSAVVEGNTVLYVLVNALYRHFLQLSPRALVDMYILLYCIVRELCSRQHNLNSGEPQWLPLFTKLEDKLCEKMKPAAELARLFNMPEKVFLKEFKYYFGCTPKAFPNKMRVQKGYELLMTTDLSISEIADHCGFADDSKFIREFKLRFNLSPKDYRSINRY